MIGPSSRDRPATNFTRPTGFIENERNRVSIEKESSSRLFILDASLNRTSTLLRGKFDRLSNNRTMWNFRNNFSFFDRVSIVRNFLSRKQKKKKRNHPWLLKRIRNTRTAIYVRNRNWTTFITIPCNLSFLNNFLSYDWWIDVVETIFHNFFVYFRTLNFPQFYDLNILISDLEIL